MANETSDSNGTATSEDPFEQACAAVCAPGTMFEIAEQEVLGQPSKVFALAPGSIRFLYDMAAARTDDYIVFEDERHTMPDILNLAGQIGHALVNDLGVTNGDRVAIAMRNSPHWVASFIAATSVGAIAVPMNAWWTADELLFALKDCEAGVVLADAARLERLDQCRDLDNPPRVVAVDDAGDGAASGATPLSELLTEGATMPEVEIGPDDDMTILYTSGTTGNPKGAVSTHRAVISALMAFAARSAVNELVTTGTVPQPGEGPTPIFMLPVPLFHVTGLIPVMLGSMVSGARLVMTYRWDPDRALELIEREGVTHFVGVPTMSWDLLEAKSFPERDVSSLVFVGGGGAPMPPELVNRIENGFPAGRPSLGYGMTETNAYGPSTAGDDFVAHPTSTGRTIPLVDMRVTDPDGNELAPGEEGELWFRGPNLIRGYWNRPDATAQTIVDGWLRSGDVGSLDEAGRVYVKDRIKDMVLRGGENIYCAEVEAAIYEHPAVHEAAVFGVPDERLGEEVAAVVMTKDDADVTAGELAQFLGERLAPFKVPSRINFVSESLPRNASGKILKRELRDAAIGG